MTMTKWWRLAASHLALCAVFLSISSRIARADDAKDSFEKGVELYNSNDYKGALAEFLAAYEAKPHHSVLYNITTSPSATR